MINRCVFSPPPPPPSPTQTLHVTVQKEQCVRHRAHSIWTASTSYYNLYRVRRTYIGIEHRQSRRTCQPSSVCKTKPSFKWTMHIGKLNVQRRTGTMTSRQQRFKFHTSEPKQSSKPRTLPYISRARGERTPGRVDSVSPCIVAGGMHEWLTRWPVVASWFHGWCGGVLFQRLDRGAELPFCRLRCPRANSHRF